MTGYVADLSWKSGARADWKVRSTKVDAGDFKHELLNRLRSTMAVNVLIEVFPLQKNVKPTGIWTHYSDVPVFQVLLSLVRLIIRKTEMHQANKPREQYLVTAVHVRYMS